MLLSSFRCPYAERSSTFGGGNVYPESAIQRASFMYTFIQYGLHQLLQCNQFLLLWLPHFFESFSINIFYCLLDYFLENRKNVFWNEKTMSFTWSYKRSLEEWNPVTMLAVLQDLPFQTHTVENWYPNNCKPNVKMQINTILLRLEFLARRFFREFHRSVMSFCKVCSLQLTWATSKAKKLFHLCIPCYNLIASDIFRCGPV